MLSRSLISTLLILSATHITPAQRTATIPDPDPEIERKSFVLPDGFEVNLWASDPLLAKPIQMNWDYKGRLWVASSEVYPQIAPGQSANDKIVILEDTRNAGKADKVTVFADGLLIPTGVEPDAKGGCYVAASTELLHFDAPKDGGKAKSSVVLSGFGTEDTHHILHTLRWGPDGKLYFNQSVYIHSHIETPYGVRRLNGGGIWQYDPKSQRLEVFARGFWNPWGTAFDQYGQMFETDGANGEGIVHVIPGASYPTGNHAAPRVLHGLNPGSPKHCGLEILSGRHLPEDYRGDLITNDFRGHRVCRFKLSENGSTFASKEMPDLIKSNHPAFRPIDVKMGPDGAIYIADWYNPIIQHGEVDFRDPRRDHTHGRIWRVTAKGRELVIKPKFEGMSELQLFQQLGESEEWTRSKARMLIAFNDRLSNAFKDKSKAEANHQFMMKLLEDVRATPMSGQRLFDTFRMLEAIHVMDFDYHKRIESNGDARLLAAFVNYMRDKARPSPATYNYQFAEIDDWIEHASPMVRLAAIRYLAMCGETFDLKSEIPGQMKPNANAVQTALRALDHPMDPTLDYALYLTVRELEPVWLPAFLDGKLVFKDPKHLAFALEAINNPATLPAIVKLIQNSKLSDVQAAPLWKALADVGGPDEWKFVFEKAAAKDTPKELADVLFADLIDASTRRKLDPKVSDAELLALGEPMPATAMRLAGLWKRIGLLKPILQTVQSVKTDAVRRAGVQAVADLGGQQAVAALKELTANANPALAADALVALIPLAEKDAAARFVKQPTADGAEAVFRAFLNRKTGPDTLTQALKEKKLPPDVAKLGLRAIKASGKDFPQLVAAFNTAGGLATLKPDYSPKAVKAMVVLAQTKGNAARGEALYRKKELQCMNCHAINGVGSAVGPDMGSIGASAQMDYLVESLWLPSKAIKEGYHSLLVNTEDGKSISGIPVREGNGELVLRTADDKQITVALNNIAERKEGKSLMPEGIVDGLTAGEQADLVRFLSELGKGAYGPPPPCIVRRWQALEITPETATRLRNQPLASSLKEADPLSWIPLAGEVGGRLPFSDVPAILTNNGTGSESAIRTQIEVTAPGKVVLLLNRGQGFKTMTASGKEGLRSYGSMGIQLLLDAKPIETKDGAEIALTKGTHTLTAISDRKMSGAPPFLVLELQEAKEGGAKFAPVLGK